MQTYQVYAMGRTARDAYQNAILSAISENPHSIAVSRGFSVVEPPIRNVPKWVEWVFAGLKIVNAREFRDSIIRGGTYSSGLLGPAKQGVRDSEKPIPKEYRELVVVTAARMQAKGDAMVSLITGREADRIRTEYGWRGLHGKTFVFYGISSN